MNDSSLIRYLLEGRKNINLTDAGLKSMVPMFVDAKVKDEDHKCATCFMRVLTGSGDAADCTIVDGGVSLSRGTCQYWSDLGSGESSSASDIKEVRMTKKEAAYVETKDRVDSIQCRTCRFYKDDYCRLWGGKVEDGDCCMAWSGEAKVF